MTTLYFVRHGETEWNATGRLQGRSDIPLNEMGKRQAEACGAYLKKYEWDVMLTSPLQRARRTAEIVNEKLQLPIYEMDEFIERDFGDAEGMTMKEILAKFPDRKYPNVEESPDLIQRVKSGLEKVQELYASQRIVLVTHGAVINYLFEALSDGQYGKNKMKLKNASISSLRYDEGHWNVLSFNESSHLEQLI